MKDIRKYSYWYERTLVVYSMLPMILVRNRIRNMLDGETDKITFGRI